MTEYGRFFEDFGRFWQILSWEKDKLSASTRLWEPFVPTLSEFWSNSKKYGTFIIADYGRFWQIMPDFDRIYQILAEYGRFWQEKWTKLAHPPYFGCQWRRPCSSFGQDIIWHIEGLHLFRSKESSIYYVNSFPGIRPPPHTHTFTTTFKYLFICKFWITNLHILPWFLFVFYMRHKFMSYIDPNRQQI